MRGTGIALSDDGHEPHPATLGQRSELGGVPASVKVDGRGNGPRADDEVQTEPVVSLRGLGKIYAPTPRWMRFLVRSTITSPIVALSDVDLDVCAGEICAVVGPNGAGKTTMFRILVGLTTPSSGHATIGGLDVHTQSLGVRHLVGWMPSEDRSLFLRLTCWENLYSHGRLHGLPRRTLVRRIPDTLAQVGLGDRIDSAGLALSAGMRARLQLARALLTRPRLLLLDEPTASVDPLGAHRLLGFIMRLVDEHQMAALISSHRLEEIEALHSNVILLDQGHVRFRGDLDALRTRYDQAQLGLEFTTPESAREAAQALALNSSIQRMGPTSLVCCPHRETTAGELLEQLGPLITQVHRIREHHRPLRDVLADMYKEEPARPAATG